MNDAREIAKQKKLKLWNGRGNIGHGEQHQYLYVCAKSGKQAVELIKKTGYWSMNYRELKNYFSKGCWGNTMDGIEPEIGVWETRGYGLKTAPKRLI